MIHGMMFHYHLYLKDNQVPPVPSEEQGEQQEAGAAPQGDIPADVDLSTVYEAVWEIVPKGKIDFLEIFSGSAHLSYYTARFGFACGTAH